MTQQQNDVVGRQIPPTLARGPRGINAPVFENFAAARAGSYASVLDGDLVWLMGHTVENDGGGGPFLMDRVDTTTVDDDGFTIVTTTNSLRLKRIMEGFVSPEMTGAQIDGVTDDTDAWQNLLTYLEDPTKDLPRKIVMPPGISMVNDALEFDMHDIDWGGAGIGASELKLMANSDLIPAGTTPDTTKARMITNLAVSTEPLSDVHLHDFTLNGNLDNQNKDANGYVRRCLEGISVSCHGSSIRRVEFQNFGPNNDTVSECFMGILIPGALGTITTAPANTDDADVSTYDQNIIEDCVATVWPSRSTMGRTGGNVVTCFLAMNSPTDEATGNSDISTSGIVRNCTVKAPEDFLPTAVEGRMRIFGSTANQITDNIFENISHCARMDSWRMSNILIQDNSGINCGSMATFNTNGTGYTQFSNVIVKNNTILQWKDVWISNSNRGVQLFADDNDDEHHWLKNVLIESNYILNRETGAASVWGIYVDQEGILATDAFIEDCVVRNNIIHYEGTGSRLIVVAERWPIESDLRIYENRDEDGYPITPVSVTNVLGIYNERNYGPAVWKVNSSNVPYRNGVAGGAGATSISGQYPRTHYFHFEEQSNGIQTFKIELFPTWLIDTGDRIVVAFYKPADNANRTVVQVWNGAVGVLASVDNPADVWFVGIFYWTGAAFGVIGSNTFSDFIGAHNYFSDSDIFVTPEDENIVPYFRGQKACNIQTGVVWEAAIDIDNGDAWIPVRTVT